MNKEIFEKMLKDFEGLNERVSECREFILDEAKFNQLDMINRDLLIAQLKAMETYLSILSIRLGINGTSFTTTDTNTETSPADAILADE